jgi:pimeloyl-ACP methyl ester carboxylesterase
VSRLATALFTLTLATCAHTEIPMTKSGLAPVNGVQLYYEIHGTGDPLIILHGAFGTIESFGPNLAALAAHRQVIGVDLQAHGRTADVDRPMTSEAMADDIAALIEHLGLERADVLGYSLGGGVAIQTAIRHPARVRRLIVVATAFEHDAYYPEVKAGFAAIGPAFAEMLKPSPIYQRYAEIAPRPDDFAVLVDKVGKLANQDYDWMAHIPSLPTMLYVLGDAEGFPLTHAVDVFTRLGGNQRDPGWDGSAGRPASQLAILPGHSHYDIVTSPVLAATVERFLTTTR